MKLIQIGSKGADVRAVQYFLIGRKLYAGTADGDFGPKTKVAVVAYQKAKGLSADGVIGNISLAAMLADGLVLMPTPDTAPAGAFPIGFPLKPSYGPMTTAQSNAAFGSYSFVSAPEPGNPEAIRITDGWDDENITIIIVPQLVTLGLSKTGRVSCHRKAAPQVLALWQAWEDAGLLKLITSWEGMYVPRFIRGSRSTLSNHAKGSAFDINYEHNELGRTPAAVGSPNSVRELVPLAVVFGFYWGGWFSRGDGMHFEIVKVFTAAELAAVVAKQKELLKFDA